MIVALASPRVASTLEEGLDRIERLLSEASARGAQIACFPEAYLPGLRGQDFEVLPFDRTQQDRALEAVARSARSHALATILGMERLTPAGRQIAAFVFDARGQLQGVQTKNQLDPSEDRFYLPGSSRQLFEIDGIKFGVVICHEGWRYPETVRWAAVRGAKIVFHPHHTGSDLTGVRPTEWGAAGGAYYEKAMMLRSMENTIYFASVNYALHFQESATSVIYPDRPAGSSLRARALAAKLVAVSWSVFGVIRAGQGVAGIGRTIGAERRKARGSWLFRPLWQIPTRWRCSADVPRTRRMSRSAGVA
jgi:predicted amidohydrolase